MELACAFSLLLVNLTVATVEPSRERGLHAIARQLHRGSVTGSAHLGRESSTSPRVILVRLCYLAALRGLAYISTSITICTLRGLMRGLAVVACVQCANAMCGLWHEPYARTDLVGYGRPQGPERQKRCISRFFLVQWSIRCSAVVRQHLAPKPVLSNGT